MSKPSRLRALTLTLRVFLIFNLLISLAPSVSEEGFGLVPPVEVAHASPNMVAHKADFLTVDVDGDNVADPGDTIHYVVFITNTGSLDAGDVLFDDTLDANSTLVAGSLRTSPIARNDTYASLGNVGISVPAGSGLLANDNDPDGTGGVSVKSVFGCSDTTAPFDCASVLGGDVSAASDGAFTYDPPPGFEGVDLFTYVIEDSDGNEDPASVFIVVAEVIWFVDNTAAPGGDGRLNSPFNSLADYSATAADDPGDSLFLYSGSGAYQGGVVLTDTQRLVGQGASASLQSIVGLTLPAFSHPLPATFGSRPTIENASGHGLVVADGNLVTGLDVGNTGGTGIVDWGGPVGTLTILDVSIAGDGGGIEIDNGGTLAVSLDSLTASSSAEEGIRLVNVNGAFSVPAGSLSTSGVPAVDIDGAPSLALAVSLGSVSADGAAYGVRLQDTTGSFAVIGSSGIDGSGGTLQNLNNSGVSLINAANVSLGNMNLFFTAQSPAVPTGSPTCDDEDSGTNTGCNAAVHMVNATNVTLANLSINDSNQHGINGNNVSGLSISNSTLTNIGDGSLENGLNFINLLGAVTLDTLSINGSRERNAIIENNQGTAHITLQNSTLSNAVVEDGFLLTAGSSGLLDATVNITLTNNSFVDNRALQFKSNAEDNSTVTTRLIGNTFDGLPASVGNVGLSLEARDNATHNFSVSGANTFTDIRSHSLNVFYFGGGTGQGTISGNTINAPADGAGAGIRVVAEVTTNASPSLTIDISNNDLNGVNGFGLAGIDIRARQGVSAATGVADIQATLNNNDVDVTNNADANIQFYVNSGNTLCANVTNNNATGVPVFLDAFYVGNPPSGDSSGPGTIILQGWTGNIDTTWNNNGNTPLNSAFNEGTAPIAGTCGTVSTASLPADGRLMAASSAAAAFDWTPPFTRLTDSFRQALAGLNPAAFLERLRVTAGQFANELVASLAVPTAYASGETLVVNLGEMNPGQQVLISFDVTVDATIPANVTQVCNQGLVSGINFADVITDDAAVGGGTDPTCTEVPQSDLQIAKTDSADPVPLGQAFSYGLTVSNGGPSPARDVVITDTLPAGVTYVGDDCGAGPPAGQVWTWNLGTLATGGTSACNLSVIAPNTAGTPTNSAGVFTTTHDPNAGNNTVSEGTTVGTPVDLSIAKTDGQTAAVPGSAVNYTIVVSNAGGPAAVGATVTDDFPTALSGVSWTCVASAGSSCAAAGSGDINDTVTILGGGSLTYSASGTIDPAATGTLANTAAVAAPAGFVDIDPTSNTATDLDALTPQADLSIAKSDDSDPVTAGGILTYTVTISNGGPSDAVGVVATDTLPGGVTFVSTSGCAEDPNGAPTCSLGSIPAGGSAQYTLQVIANSDGLITNNVSVTSSIPDPDNSNNSASEDTTVNPPNQPPAITSLTLDPAAIDENDTAELSGTFADPDVGDTHMVTIRWGDGSSDTVLNLTGGERAFSASHQYLDDAPTGTPSDQYALTVTVEDAAGESDSAGAMITVNNLAPIVGPIAAPVDPVEVGDQPISATAVFTDPGRLDVHTAVWDWGDGSTSAGTIVGSGGSGTASGSHTYAAPGVYTLGLSVTDDDGGTGRSVYQFVVIYDPAGGFVTGGGWIYSPPGAYPPDPSLAGRATFGFVSRYKKGASAPSGHTEFQFKAGDLNFNSQSYQWLVVAGPKAQFKGLGTINGGGNYGFLLSAIDASLTPSTDADLFRIKIWDKDNHDAVVYDNQLGDAQDADPAAALGGGSIVIHQGK